MKPIFGSIAAAFALIATASFADTARLPEGKAIAQAAPIALLVDIQSGQTLYASESDRRFIPASITKVMTAYVAFELMAAGELRPNQRLTFDESAAQDWYRTGSTLFLEPGEAVTVDVLLKGITSVSANDASIVLAQGALGSVDNWTTRMNRTARRLGMTDSHFGTPNGWPDDGKTFTSAHDLAKLAQALIADHPQQYARYFGQSGFRHNGFAQANHDPISGVIEGADGIKTGFTNQAGHGFLGSAQRGDTRLIMVVAAVESETRRAQIARQLIGWGFDGFARHKLFDKGAEVARARVQDAHSKSVTLLAGQDIVVALPIGIRTDPVLKVRYEGPLDPPIMAGQQVAQLQIEVEGIPTAYVPLVADRDIAPAGPVRRIINAFESWTD